MDHYPLSVIIPYVVTFYMDELTMHEHMTSYFKKKMFQQHVQTLYNIRTIRSYPPNIVSSNVFSCNAFLATVPTVALVFHLSPRYLYIIVDGDAIVHE